MSKLATKLKLGSNRNLIGVFTEKRDCPTGEVDEWWSATFYIPVAYEFLGDQWDTDIFRDRRGEFREKFENVVEATWSPIFDLYGPQRSSAYVFVQTTVRCFVDLKVLDVERTNFKSVLGTWTLKSLKATNQPITKIKVFPDQSGGNYNLGIMEIGENLSLLDKPAFKGDPHPQKQIDAAHEMGHVFGFEHPVCAQSADHCYGRAGTPKNASIMGRGMNASSLQQKLFVHLMSQMDNHYDWSIWKDVIARNGLTNRSRRDGFAYPSGAANLPGPLGRHRYIG